MAHQDPAAVTTGLMGIPGDPKNPRGIAEDPTAVTTDPKGTLGIAADPRNPAAVSTEPVVVAAGLKDP